MQKDCEKQLKALKRAVIKLGENATCITGQNTRRVLPPKEPRMAIPAGTLPPQIRRLNPSLIGECQLPETVLPILSKGMK